LERAWRLEGRAAFGHEGQPCALDYDVHCDADWRTTSGGVQGWIADREIRVTLAVGPGRRWTVNGAPCPDVEGCMDLDLNFSPSTNLLPIRRLGLAVGQSAVVRAAWLRSPSFALEPLDQRYTRLDLRRYRYESDGGRFRADLEVNDAGFVVRYPGFANVD
jgi:hypothetical protein